MKTVATIIAILLLLLGGGCTLVSIYMAIPASMFSENYGEALWNTVIPLWLVLGLLPLALGILILRAQKRGGAIPAAADPDAGKSKPQAPPENGEDT